MNFCEIVIVVLNDSSVARRKGADYESDGFKKKLSSQLGPFFDTHLQLVMEEKVELYYAKSILQPS